MADNTVEINITADVMEAQAELKSLERNLQNLVNIQNDSLNKFDERTTQFQEHIKTSITNVKGNIDQVISKIQELKGEDLGSGLSNSIEKTKSSLVSLGQMIKTAFVYDVAFQAINKLEEALSGLAHQTLEVDSQFEQLKIGIAGQLAANTNYTGSTKKVADEQENFNIAMIKSESVFNRLRQASVNTGIPLEQLGKGFMASVGPATRAGMSTEQLTNFVEKMGSVAKATSIPMNRLGAEIRDLMTGQRSQLSLEMGVTEAWIAQHKAVGDLGQAYIDMANKYDAMVEAQSNTWEGVKNKVINSIQQIENKASEDVFAQLKDGAVTLQENLSKNFNQMVDSVRKSLNSMYEFSYGIFTDLKVIFDSLTPTSEHAGMAVSFLATTFQIAMAGISMSVNGIRGVWDIFTSTIINGANSVGQLIVTLSNSFQDLLHLNFSDAKKEWANYFSDVKQNLKSFLSDIHQAADDIQERTNEIASGNNKNITTNKVNIDTSTAQGRLADLKNKYTEVGKAISDLTIKRNTASIDERVNIDKDIKSLQEKQKAYLALEKDKAYIKEGTLKGTSRDDPDKGKKPKGLSSEIAKYEEALNVQKLAIEKSGQEMSLEQEANYWDKLISQTKNGTALHSEVIAKAQEAHKRIIEESKRESLSPIQEMQRELDAQKEIHAVSLVEEKAFWDKKLQEGEAGARKLTEKVKQEIEHKSANLKVRIDEQISEEKKGSASVSSKKTEGKEQESIDRDKSINEMKLQNKQITNREKLENDIAYENASYASAQIELDREIKIYGEDSTQAKAANEKNIANDKNHFKNLDKLNRESANESGRLWLQASNIMENSLANAINSIIMKTSSLADAFRNMGRAILSGMVQMASQEIALEIFTAARKTAIWQTLTGTKVASKAVEMATDKTAAAAKVATEVGANATVVAAHVTTETVKTGATATGVTARIGMVLAEAYASIAAGAAAAWTLLLAAYSWAGPAAPALAGATVGVGIAGAYSALSQVSHSASGGFDIPNGVNPVTQLHQNEMVLPAHIAQPLRESLKNGGVGGGHTYNVNITAMDAKGVKSFMIDNQDALVSAMKMAHRNAKV